MSLPEFIGPLSICSNTMQDQYEEDFLKFTGYITGDAKRREALEAAMGGDDDGGGKKGDRKSTRLNSSHSQQSRMPSSA